MTALWYKWYILLRNEHNASVLVSLIEGWWNAILNDLYYTEGPKKWIDNRPDHSYEG